MHLHKNRLGWLILVGIYWALQLIYILSPVDFVPDVLPVVGFGDDLVGILSAFAVTAFGAYKAFGDKLPVLPRGQANDVIDVSPEPMSERHPDYQPLTPEELKAL